MPSGNCRPTVLPTPTITKSHSHRPSWVSSRNRVLTPGRAVRCGGPPGQGSGPAGHLGSASRRCADHRRSGALPTQGPNQGVAPPLRGPPLLRAKGSWRGCRSSKRARPFEDARGRPLRSSSGPPREEDEPPTGSLFWLSWQPLRSVPLGCQEEVVPTPPSPLTAPEAKASQGACSTHHAPVHVPPSRALTSLLQPRPLGWQAAVGARFVAERPSTECPSWSTLHYSSAARQLMTRSSTLPLWTTRSGSRRGRCLRNRWKASWPGRSLSIARAPQGLWTSRP